MSQNLQKFAKFQKIQLDNLVDFEKCCKTYIFLQKSVPIQPKTSENLPKIYQKLATTLRVRRPEDRSAELDSRALSRSRTLTHQNSNSTQSTRPASVGGLLLFFSQRVTTGNGCSMMMFRNSLGGI